MVDLTTDYLGLKLANPLVPSASPLSKDVRQRQATGRCRRIGGGDVFFVRRKNRSRGASNGAVFLSPSNRTW